MNGKAVVQAVLLLALVAEPAPSQDARAVLQAAATRDGHRTGH